MRVRLTKATSAPAKPVRRITKAKITHISLCSRGKNRQPVLMKSGNRLQVEMLTKAGKEGLLYALVYVPDRPDADGDVASAEVIKGMAHDFLANAAEAGGGIDIEHNLQTLGPDKVRIAETFIVQKGDPRFEGWSDYEGAAVDPTGSWGVALKILDPELRKAAERGELNGVSMFGTAEVESVKSDTSTPQPQDDIEMTPEQLQAAIEAALAKALPKAEPTPAPVVPPAPAKITFEGDPTNLDDIAKHEEKLFMASLDLSKAEDVAKLRARVEAKKAQQPAPASETETPAEDVEKSDRVKALELELANLRKSSNAGLPAPKGKDAVDAEKVTGLKKADLDLAAHGRGIAARFQGRKA